MTAFIGALIVGVICIILGVSNMRGNISSLHSYHRKRVSEEDRIPFGKRVGLGTVIVGASIVILSGFSIATLLTNNQLFMYVGYAFLIVGLVIGLIISFHAMIKYNKGIF
ncbi:MAG: hypothetical protein J6U86_00175 [Clostridia bacterium]|nr:hypothetical protein [Clostridia bacterium]